MKNSKTKYERISLLDSLPIQHTEHFGRPLKDYLVGTHDLLDRWSGSEELRLARLFHSVCPDCVGTAGLDAFTGRYADGKNSTGGCGISE